MALNRNNRQKARSAFFGNNSGLETSKYSVSDNFHVIPDVTHNVVVPYGQATELLDMLHRGELSEKISVLRRLQEYTVSLFDDDYHDLARKHAISLANEDFGVFLLNEEYYNDKYGVVREAEMPLLLM